MQDIKSHGFEGWWSPVERLVGIIEFNHKTFFLAQSLPWDGAAGGRLDTILKHTEPKNKHRVRDFFSQLQPISSILSESIKIDLQRTSGTACIPPLPIILLSRYRDNIYISLLNLSLSETAMAKIVISALLNSIYGIRLKWEQHTDIIVWGECQTSHNSRRPLSLQCKGTVSSLGDPAETPEWCRWVDAHSPHARIVWRSHFPSILLKCIWHALGIDDVRHNLRSAMWGIGVKNYTTHWWRPILRRFFLKSDLGRCISFTTLVNWREEGRRQASTQAAFTSTE